MIYTLRKRLVANVCLIASLVLLFSTLRGKSELFIAVALVIFFVPCVVSYALYLLSLKCPKCGNTFGETTVYTFGKTTGFPFFKSLKFAPLRVPRHCYSCGAKATW